MVGKLVKNIVRSHPCAHGGIAELTYATKPDGGLCVIRELHKRYFCHVRMHLRFIRGTKVRKLLTPYPFLCGSLERGWSGMHPYEIIEAVPGKNLEQLISNRDPYVKEHRFEILRQAATALAYVHERGYVHLDMKAENLLVDPSQESCHVKLTDFDLVRDLSSRRDRKRAGTAKSMAPEQVRKGVVGVEADIFAFGVFAYYLIAGRMPFVGTTERERRAKQCSNTSHVKALRRIEPSISHKLEWLVMSCLEKNPRNRFPSMSYLLQELDRSI